MSVLELPEAEPGPARGGSMQGLTVELRLLEARVTRQRSLREWPAHDRTVLDRRLRALRGLLADEVLATPAGLSREDRMDSDRRVQARRGEHLALLEHYRSRPEGDELPLPTLTWRAVVAHRNDWFRERLGAELTQRGVEVVASLDDGAAATGVVLAEQPDVVLVEDLLPRYNGLEVLDRVARHAPSTLLAAQLADSSAEAEYLARGATTSTRRVPPREVADRVLRCLQQGPETIVLA